MDWPTDTHTDRPMDIHSDDGDMFYYMNFVQNGVDETIFEKSKHRQSIYYVNFKKTHS